MDENLVGGGHFGFHASVTLCHGFSKSTSWMVERHGTWNGNQKKNCAYLNIFTGLFGRARTIILSEGLLQAEAVEHFAGDNTHGNHAF